MNQYLKNLESRLEEIHQHKIHQIDGKVFEPHPQRQKVINEIRGLNPNSYSLTREIKYIEKLQNRLNTYLKIEDNRKKNKSEKQKNTSVTQTSDYERENKNQTLEKKLTYKDLWAKQIAKSGEENETPQEFSRRLKTEEEDQRENYPGSKIVVKFDKNSEMYHAIAKEPKY